MPVVIMAADEGIMDVPGTNVQHTDVLIMVITDVLIIAITIIIAATMHIPIMVASAWQKDAMKGTGAVSLNATKTAIMTVEIMEEVKIMEELKITEEVMIAAENAVMNMDGDKTILLFAAR